jgi:hypothetical protein
MMSCHDEGEEELELAPEFLFGWNERCFIVAVDYELFAGGASMY